MERKSQNRSLHYYMKVPACIITYLFTHILDLWDVRLDEKLWFDGVWAKNKVSISNQLHLTIRKIPGGNMIINGLSITSRLDKLCKIQVFLIMAFRSTYATDSCRMYYYWLWYYSSCNQRAYCSPFAFLKCLPNSHMLSHSPLKIVDGNL